MSYFKKVAVAVFVAVLFAGASSAQAAILISMTNTPQAGDENVLLTNNDLGNPLYGTTQTSDFVVKFSSNEMLTSQASGQARIDAQDGSLTQLTTELVDGTYTSLILNIDAMANGSVTFDVTKAAGGVYSQTFALTGSGNNFFTIVATLGDRIDSVFFTTSVAATLTQIEDAGQFRIGGALEDGGGGVINPNMPVPEPATMLLLGTGLLAAARARRKNNVS